LFQAEYFIRLIRLIHEAANIEKNYDFA